MFCAHCGSNIGEGVQFCPNCGTKTGNAGPEPVMQTQYQQANTNDQQRIVIEHAAKKGQDMSSGFGRGFGETLGNKIGGFVWKLIGFIVFLIIIVLLLYQCQ